ncbi:MAG: DNA polymerase III subunit beta [Leptolyngbyaceae cyanobacterium MO_188.B28]|nr:DNA polymerase III subunit beta [Leptolyngbyaceae cyanobacterium MO_188.B28]
MKFTCAQSELNTHLSVVSRAVPSRPSKPILGNVLLKADMATQQVTLIGFDESLGIETSFSAQIEQTGTLTLPAKLLTDIVSRLPSEDINLEETDSDATLILTCSSGHYQVRGMSSEDFPSLPLVKEGQAATLSPEGLLEGLQGSLFATSPDETKQVLTGVHLIVEPEILEFAATDGHRLAVVQTVDQKPDATSEEASVSELDVTVPAKALRELERVLQLHQTTEAIALRFDPTQVIFELGQQRITTRLLEGQYPNYRQLIPKQFERQMTLDRKQLIAALERIAVLADQKNNIVKLTLDNDQQTLALSVEAQEVGSGREIIPAQISGDNLEIAFNVKYLLDGLKVIACPEVQVQCNTATSPSILTPLSGVKMTYLVMPVQIRS